MEHVTHIKRVTVFWGRAIAQRVSRRLPTAAARVDPRSGHVGSVVDTVALGQVLSEYFGFPCQCSFHRLLHTHHLSSGAGTIGQILADVPSGPSLTPPQETTKTTTTTVSVGSVQRYNHAGERQQ
jgi:hypothetical protein